jgi:hypothetical protein
MITISVDVDLRCVETANHARPTETARQGGVAAALAASLTLVAGSPANASAANTDPAGAGANSGADPAAHLPGVPSPTDFLGFPLGIGQQRVVTNAEIRATRSARTC